MFSILQEVFIVPDTQAGKHGCARAMPANKAAWLGMIPMASLGKLWGSILCPMHVARGSTAALFLPYFAIGVPFLPFLSGQADLES